MDVSANRDAADADGVIGIGVLVSGLLGLGLVGTGLVRLLQAALLLHVGAVALALVTPHALHLFAILLTGLVVTLLALSLPHLAEKPAGDLPASLSPTLLSLPLHSPASLLSQTHVSTLPTEVSIPQEDSRVAPSPLPFMGDRIALDTNGANLTGLARAAAHIRRMPSVRTHPWGDLIARVSHELRTPLNAVIGFSDVMEAELLGPVGHPRYREYARHIRDSGRELLKSAEDTLAITCLLDHDPDAAIDTTVDFQALVDEAWAFHAAPHASNGLSLEVTIPEGLEVLIDRRPMRQILINLFAEAVRRSDSRGTVGLVASAVGDLVQIEVFLRGRPDSTAVGQASLPICLARALLEMQGAALIEVDDPFSTWRALTMLRCSTQSDFFDSPVSYEQPSVHLC